VTDISNIGAAAALWEYQHIWDPLASSTSAGVMLGLARGSTERNF